MSSPSEPAAPAGRALVVAGAGRYADPWHPFAATAAALADVVRGAGLDVDVTPDEEGAVEDALARLVDPAARPDLLLLSVGLPRDGAPSPAPGPALDGLRAFCAEGRALLGCHVAATSFVEVPAWEDRLGGRWVRDVTWHPEIGPASVRVRRGAHPSLADGGGPPVPDVVELVDEVYCDLRVADDVVVLADAEHEGRTHPLAWVREEPGGRRTAYDALGHDERSFASAGHRALLDRLVRWLAAAPASRA